MLNEILLENAELELRVLSHILEGGDVGNNKKKEVEVNTFFSKIKILLGKFINIIKRFFYNHDKRIEKIKELENELYHKFKPFECDMLLYNISRFNGYIGGIATTIETITLNINETMYKSQFDKFGKTIKSDTEWAQKALYEVKAKDEYKHYKFKTMGDIIKYDSIKQVELVKSINIRLNELVLKFNKFRKENAATIDTSFSYSIGGSVNVRKGITDDKEMCNNIYKLLTISLNIIHVVMNKILDQTGYYIKLLKIGIEMSSKDNNKNKGDKK